MSAVGSLWSFVSRCDRQRSVMGLGISRVSAALRPAENFLEEMVDKQNDVCYSDIYD